MREVRWQELTKRECFGLLATLQPRHGRQGALPAMLERYLECAATDQPVHTWPTHP